MQHTFELKDKLFKARFTGSLQAGDLLKLSDAFYKDAHCADTRCCLIDCSDATATAVHEREIQHLSAIDYGSRSYVKQLAVAIVATDELTRQNFERYIQAVERLDFARTCRLFDSLDAAEDWLTSLTNCAHN